jgi:GntR family transcriptional regulator/MocR family aminotransferase
LLEWLCVDRESATPLHRQIREQLVAAALDGRLPPGTVLPSSRVLSADLGVARGTVALAYEALLGEGIIDVRGRSAAIVAGRVTRQAGAAEDATDAEDAGGEDVEHPPPHRAFLPGLPALELFPAARWARLLARRSLEMTQELGDNDFHVGGYLPLRAALARHLKTSRGIDCAIEQIVITSSARAALSVLCQLFAKPDSSCLVEDPGYILAHRILADLGVTLVPLPVDEHGMNVDGPIPPADLAYVTPTHQMPLGSRLSNRRCRALVDWAERNGAWIIEDDYDSEFRYAGEAIAALHSAYPEGRIIHIGTFSKTLFPSLRVAYLVVPKSLAQRVGAAVYLHGREPPLHVQAALADFIAGGHYAAHIARTRLVYRRRQGLLVDALNRHLDMIDPVRQRNGGINVIVPLPAHIPAREVQARGAKVGLHARSVSFYALQATPNALDLGFAALSDDMIEPAVIRLADVIRSIVEEQARAAAPAA